MARERERERERTTAALTLVPSSSVDEVAQSGTLAAGCDADCFAVDRHGVTAVKLAAATLIDFAVDLDETIFDELGGFNAVVDQASELEQLA